jgi:opacity protein-like surface antigen
MAGALYNDVSAGISLKGPTDRVREQSAGDDWVDPIVGVLFETPIGAGNWSFTGSAQIGGFGVGADLVTILTGSFSYRFNNWSSIDIGYRYLDFDYEDGDGLERFKFDMKEHGPAVGWRFDF